MVVLSPAIVAGPWEEGEDVVADMQDTFSHTPVMVREALEALSVHPGGTYIDATLGEGGHSEAILEAAPGARVLGLDVDAEAIGRAQRRLARYDGQFTAAHSSYVHMEDVARAYGLLPVDGVFFDLGLSSLQLGSERGFSFQRRDALDMRFDAGQELTASDVVNSYSLKDLTRVIAEYGEEPRAAAIARGIMARRPIGDTQALAEAVAAALGGRHGKIHPATRTFQAIRMEVNGELENVRRGLEAAIGCLRPGGRLAVISYHSVEDRVVKETLRRESSDCVCPPAAPVCVCGHKATLSLVSRKVIKPSDQEVRANPRGRSARMRVAERL